MKRIDSSVREGIAEIAEELEAEGIVVSRRELAREFGVSPQTIARILDGPDARRGTVHVESAETANHSGAAAVGLGVAAILFVWWWGTGRRG